MKKMNRRGFLSTSLAAAGALPGCKTARAGRADRTRPNIVLIITDDQGYGDLSCHGNPILKTPNLDRLHGESVRFTQFHVCPVCSPTRSSLMTGRYNYRTGVVDTYQGRSMMDPRETTLPQVLASHGYRTGIFGKWHLGDNYPMRAMDRGFQEALVHGGGGLSQPSDPPPGNRYFDPVLNHNGTWEKHQGYCTDIFTDAAIQFIEKHRDTPFFAYLALNAPHVPLDVADCYAKPYLEQGMDEKTARLYGMIANIDENIGRLDARLERLGLAENTWLIFMTDNGSQVVGDTPRYNAGMRGWKGAVYEGGIRVPCFMRWPRTWRGGQDRETLAAHIDVMPTLLDGCGFEAPRGARMDGMSLMPVLRDPESAWPDRTLFTQWHRGNRPEPYRNCAVFNRRYKLVDGKELYDRVADPGESADIAGDHPDIVANMRKEYEAWFTDVCGQRDFSIPPRIHLGTHHENPTLLTRQDWRCETNWTDPRSVGYWEVKVVRSGLYDIGFEFELRTAVETARFRLGGAMREVNVPADAGACAFKGVRLERGEGRLEATVTLNGLPAGVRYVTIRRTGGQRD
ncbi:MAG TPA: arylsulfatase [Candidatus Hydrogenedentes bacterium]|nr:arylsulfatase [Candidatus Hydrogenedentota bacterium]